MNDKISLVMIVDDDEDIREALAAVLTAAGFTVEAFGSATLAWHALLLGLVAPAVVILDHGMPIMNGTEFRRHQIGDARTAAIPVILYTADDDVEMAGVLVLSKCVSPRLLIAAVHDACTGPQLYAA